MQTFLPYANFELSAQVLDRQRLGKQRVETMQIMKALLTGEGWINHPATLQWRGYEIALLDYQLAVCDEWAAVRGYQDTCADKTLELVAEHGESHALGLYLEWAEFSKPEWLGLPAYHRSHQSNLIRKNAAHYAPLFGDVPDHLPYVWPSEFDKEKT